MKILGARGIGKDPGSSFSLFLASPFRRLDGWWTASSDDFLRLDLLALAMVATGDLDRDRDLELERDRFLIRTELVEEEAEAVEGASGLDLSTAGSLAASLAVSLVGGVVAAAAATVPVEEPLLLADFACCSALVNGCRRKHGEKNKIRTYTLISCSQRLDSCCDS